MGSNPISLSLHTTLPPPSSVAPSEDTPIHQLVNDALSKNYSSICAPLTNDAWKERWRSMCLRSGFSTPDPNPMASKLQMEEAERWRAGGCFLRGEVNLSRIDEAERVIGMVSDWLQLDSPDERARYDSEVALQRELSHASYLNMAAVILPPPRNRAHIADYARAVNACLTNTGLSQYMQLSVRIPIYVPSQAVAQAGTGSSTRQGAPALHTKSPPGQSIQSAPTEVDLIATWEMWDTIKTICEYNPRLSLTLDLTSPLPASVDILSRWAAEPTRHIFLPATSFIPNTRGYPVLMKPAQNFLRDMIQYRPTVILSGTEESHHSNGGEQAYPQYIRYLEKTSPAVQAMETPGTVESFAQGYFDYLQAPLQPLMDNLQSTTYEVFEKDPVKYTKYEDAVFKALLDRPKDSRTVICVAGAGRGPIVARCLKAVENSKRDAAVYAVEKNPNAYLTLQERNENEWDERVILLYGDMRTIDVPEKADIIVSELLGSFGDNELSPECLDGAMRFMKPDGISIPTSYTAHLAPLSSSKLYNEVTAMSKDVKAAETPYVVMFQAVNILSGPAQGQAGARVQQAWEFEHPRKDVVLNAQGLPLTNTHNARSAHLTFHIPYAGVLHGLAGYFEAHLYGDVGLSIHPERKDSVSANMLSWFPIFFPFKDPLYLPGKAELDVSIWRLTDKRKVWYEWYAESFLQPYISTAPKSLGKSSAVSHSTSANPPLPTTTVKVDAKADAGSGSPMLDDVPSRTSSPYASPAVEPRIKVGQTALHNPGGRSSWIGL